MLSRVSVSSRALHRSAKNCVRGPLTFPGWYPRDHMPDSYPETDEERRAAAIKYGLRPEDYNSFSYFLFGPISKNSVTDYAGSYPDLGFMTYDNRDPYESYSDNHNRRNWGEPMQMSWMAHRADRNSYSGLDIEDFSLWNFIKYTTLLLVPMGIFGYIHQRADPNNLHVKSPKMIKQYPYDYYRTFPYGDPQKYPITNYTFEPAE